MTVLKKEKKTQINNIALGLKKLEKKIQKIKSIPSRMKTIKIRPEINKIETKTTEKINKTKFVL